MRLATIRNAQGTAAAVDTGSGWRPINGVSDVNDLLSRPDWRELADAAGHREDVSPLDESTLEFAAVVPAPGKVICVGLNYASHIREMGRELPAHPTLFAKFAETLTGPTDPVIAVAEDSELDWEGEMALVIGARAHRVTEAEARSRIAGYTVANDISMRGWQFRTVEWLQGKIWAESTPVGPYLVTTEAFDWSRSRLRTTVNGQVMQDHAIGDLVFSPEQLVAYISTMLPLNPGDLILTGTPGGVGRARDPQVYLSAGDVVEVLIDGLGTLRTPIVEP